MSYLEDRPTPGSWMLFFSVILPVAAVLFELATGLCAGIFFDPIPTWPHTLAVLAVPAVNFAVWRALRLGEPYPRWLLVAACAAMAISGLYALTFLPLAPIAIVAILFLGLGLLPLAPILSFVATARMIGPLAGEAEHAGRRCFAGVAIGLLALLLVDLPATATFVAIRWSSGDEASVARAASLMRIAGDRSMLLRLCYGDDGRATGIGSFFASDWSDGLFQSGRVTSNQAARELWFRATGTPFSAAERPRRGRDGLFFDWDEDRGGTMVGQRANGLRLEQSRIDGSVAVADNVAYLEWTATIANQSSIQQEARLTLALPAGAVASRATLWVNGEPREASVAGRGEARAAYQSVVQARRDPLLVTTDGAGRLLIQAFPVQPSESLTFRIGLSAPLEIGPDGSRNFALPAIADRNFEMPSDLRHAVWVEGDGPIAWKPSVLSRPDLASGARLRIDFSDDALSNRRPRIWAAQMTEPSLRTAIVPEKTPGERGRPAAPLAVSQIVARASIARPSALTILVDGSAGNRDAAEGLRRALDVLPDGLPVALLIASNDPQRVESAPWSPTQRQLFETALDDSDFVGGEDNLPALAEALKAPGQAGATLLWIHGPQPVAFARSQGRLTQLLERSFALPRLVRYQSRIGPDYVVAGNAWFEGASEAIPTGDPAADLSALLTGIARGGRAWRVTRTEAGALPGSAASVHVARLWAADRLAAGASLRGEDRDKAIALAARLNIVTPVSGAVVLETDRDYRANGLDIPDPKDVPTVPEPATWALMAITLLLLLWMWRRRARTAFV